MRVISSPASKSPFPGSGKIQAAVGASDDLGRAAGRPGVGETTVYPTQARGPVWQGARHHGSDPVRHRGRAPARATPARPAARAAHPPGRASVMAKIGYARISTRNQKDDSQLDELTVYGCDKIITDKASGRLAARPELDKALAYLRQGDVFVITRLSRAMRSLKHLLALADELRERGVGLVVLKQHIDTTTPG